MRAPVPPSLRAGAIARFSPGKRYLVGVSAGRDSVALLHWLGTMGYKNLIVCHFDHQLRGRSSAADARFVAKLAEKQGIRLETGSASVARFAKQKKLSLESAARELRYSFFANVAKRTGCRTIFLGHHADDLVETFLINLFRGSGTTGLAAMREASTRRINKVDLTIVRPLLAIWRDEIDNYVRTHRLKFREDSTNQDLAPLRNRIRRKVIPYLEKTLGRSIRRNIWRTAMIAAEEENFFEALLPLKSSNLNALSVKSLRDLDVAVQRRMLHNWLNGAIVPAVGFDLIERVRALLDTTGRVAKTNLPEDRHVRRRAGKLFIE
jgi:tRNA(Ile)-lysidine synthase